MKSTISFPTPHTPHPTPYQPSWEIPESVYIHIPFCRRRCFYCDFPISVIGNKTEPSKYSPIETYVQWLVKEINLSVNLGKPLQTVFFGGGTPSLLPVQELSKILETLERKFGLAQKAEISLEIDPGTFTIQQLREYQRLGINRVSLGVQAFQDEILLSCGRSHNVADIWQAVQFLEAVGFTNFSLDLISGLPHQSLEQWENSLLQAISISPTHLSCYDLVLEEVTPFGKRYQVGEFPLPTDENAAQMYRLAQQKLTQAGYKHYEISNYALDGYQCQHNRVYWENRSFYAFGMGAASYLEGTRYISPRTRVEYYEYVEGLPKVVDDLPSRETAPKNQNTQKDIFLETLMLGFRLAEGVSIPLLAQNFGHETISLLLSLLEPYQAKGWVKISQDRVCLSDPEGFLFSNVVLTRIFEKM